MNTPHLNLCTLYMQKFTINLGILVSCPLPASCLSICIDDHCCLIILNIQESVFMWFDVKGFQFSAGAKACCMIKPCGKLTTTRKFCHQGRMYQEATISKFYLSSELLSKTVLFGNNYIILHKCIFIVN